MLLLLQLQLLLQLLPLGTACHQRLAQLCNLLLVRFYDATEPHQLPLHQL
jgi:hypothetical protein